MREWEFVILSREEEKENALQFVKAFAETQGENRFVSASVWCCIENIFLAATAEGLACSMRIPVGNEGLQVAETDHAPKGYMLPCYIGLGFPTKDAVILEQVEHQVKSTLHFGKW